MKLRNYLFFIFLIFSNYNQCIAKEYKYGVELSSTGKLQHWSSLPIKLCINKSVPTEFHNKIKNAVASWNSNFIVPIFTINCISNEDISKLEDKNSHSIFWEASNFSKYTSITSLATTLKVSDDESGNFIDADIIINAQVFNWSTGLLDLETVILHELGHVLGIKHLFMELGSALNYYSYLSGYTQHNISNIDKMIIENIYFKGTHNTTLIDLTLNKKYIRAIKILKTKSKLTLNESYNLAYLYKKTKAYAKCAKQLTNLDYKGLPLKLKASVLLLKGDCYWTVNSTSKAKNAFSNSLRYLPNYYEAKANLASIYLHEGKYKIAKDFFLDVLKVNPLHYIACFHLNNLDKPRKSYRECVKKYSPDQSLLNLMKK